MPVRARAGFGCVSKTKLASDVNVVMGQNENFQNGHDCNINSTLHGKAVF